MPLVWIDHSGDKMFEGEDNDHKIPSHHNAGEAMVVACIYHHYRSVIGVPDADIGIITGYWAQVAYIRKALDEINPEYSDATVRTIDGYQ